MVWRLLLVGMSCIFSSCFFIIDRKDKDQDSTETLPDSAAIQKLQRQVNDTTTRANTSVKDTAVLPPSEIIDTKNIHPEEIVQFAQTMIGTPYRYASTDPDVGFDCSGFITYVFNHFGIAVPRSSVNFTNVGKEIPLDSVKRGDLILFTGTDSTEELVGHMGIIVSGKDSIQFIHSTSGKANGVTITPLNKYYLSRYVKTVRVFKKQ